MKRSERLVGVVDGSLLWADVVGPDGMEVRIEAKANKATIARQTAKKSSALDGMVLDAPAHVVLEELQH